MGLGTFKAHKDPSEIKEYSIDYETELNSATIASSSWELTGDVINENDQFTDTTTRLWVSKGRVGTVDKATNTVITSNGETIVRTIEILIRGL